jgi:hypothetical protein
MAEYKFIIGSLVKVKLSNRMTERRVVNFYPQENYYEVKVFGRTYLYSAMELNKWN